MNPFLLTDAHNHLQDEWLRPHLGAIAAELEALGTVRAVVNGTTEVDWGDVAALASRHAWVQPSYGLHPWFIRSRTPHWLERLRERLDGDPRCCVGEIGLDRWMEGFDLDDQRAVFLPQLALAAERDRPVTIHCLKAWGALTEILRRVEVPRRGFLLHAYSGPSEMVKELVDLGAYFSFSGSFLHERKERQRAAFREVPADRLLVETDAPAMPLPAGRERHRLPDTPEGNRVNHPANLIVAYEGLADLRGLPVETLARMVGENADRFFGPGEPQFLAKKAILRAPEAPSSG